MPSELHSATILYSEPIPELDFDDAIKSIFSENRSLQIKPHAEATKRRVDGSFLWLAFQEGCYAKIEIQRAKRSKDTFTRALMSTDENLRPLGLDDVAHDHKEHIIVSVGRGTGDIFDEFSEPETLEDRRFRLELLSNIVDDFFYLGDAVAYHFEPSQILIDNASFDQRGYCDSIELCHQHAHVFRAGKSFQGQPLLGAVAFGAEDVYGMPVVFTPTPLILETVQLLPRQFSEHTVERGGALPRHRAKFRDSEGNVYFVTHHGKTDEYPIGLAEVTLIHHRDWPTGYKADLPKPWPDGADTDPMYVSPQIIMYTPTYKYRAPPPPPVKPKRARGKKRKIVKMLLVKILRLFLWILFTAGLLVAVYWLMDLIGMDIDLTGIR